MKMAKLRKMLTHPGKNESGQGVLAIVLLLLMLGAIILTPLLVFMSTGVKAGQVYESKLQEFYAADAGVEDAIWEIKDGNLSVPVYSYSLDEKVNDRNVTITINDTGTGIYLINSTATSGDGGSTTIECYVLNIPSFLNLFDNAITSNGTVCVKGDVNGSVVAADCTPQGEGCNTTNCTTNTTINWPSELQLSTYYRKQVKDLTSYEGDIDIDGSDTFIPRLYKDGTLDIYNGKNTPATATLNGTVYVTNDPSPSTEYDLQIGVKVPKNFTLNLNDQTIFCEGGIKVTDACNITGSGCIIAVGDVYFAPKGDVGGLGDFVFLMSIEGSVTLQPGGDFYGSVAGNADVTLRPGNLLQWINPDDLEGTLNFPTETVGELTVVSYTIK